MGIAEVGVDGQAPVVVELAAVVQGDGFPGPFRRLVEQTGQGLGGGARGLVRKGGMCRSWTMPAFISNQKITPRP